MQGLECSTFVDAASSFAENPPWGTRHDKLMFPNDGASRLRCRLHENERSGWLKAQGTPLWSELPDDEQPFFRRSGSGPAVRHRGPRRQARDARCAVQQPEAKK